MPTEDRAQDVQDIGTEPGYERPKLVVLGNLRDLLAGGGSKVCDGTVNQPGPSNVTC